MIKRTYSLMFGLVLLAGMVAVVLGCRRSLTDDLGDTALVPIQIDWSQSMVDLKQTHNVSIWFYPHDGSLAFEYRMEGDLQSAVIPLGVGSYSVIVFNESVDLNDYETVPLVFSNSGSYEDFSVSTKKANSQSSAYYSKTTDIPLRMSPDVVASWSIDNFEVTWDMVVVTRSRSKASIVKSLANHTVSRSQMNVVDQELSKAVNIVPLPLVKSVEVKAHVKNLIAATEKASQGKFTGATIAMSLASRQPIIGTVSHTFTMSTNSAVWDDPSKKKDGTLSTKFWIFEHQDNPKYELDLDFLLTDGKVIPNHFELSNKVDKEVFEIVISVGADPTKPDDATPPIVLPDPDKNTVGVKEWEDEEHVILK